jgi:hypothetical protein
MAFTGIHLLLVCLAVGVNASAYNETLARDRLIHLASSAYSERPEDCLKEVFSDAFVGVRELRRGLLS